MKKQKSKKASKPEGQDPEDIRNVVTNRRARYEYHFVERMEAGIVLQGTEVKSLRNGNCSLQEAFADVRDGELWIREMHIAPYEAGTIWNHEPKRPRKLLMHRREIFKLATRIAEKGLTLIPIRVYFKNGKAKVELALARGKKFYDKREDIRERDAERETSASMKGY